MEQLKTTNLCRGVYRYSLKTHLWIVIGAKGDQTLLGHPFTLQNEGFSKCLNIWKIKKLSSPLLTHHLIRHETFPLKLHFNFVFINIYFIIVVVIIISFIIVIIIYFFEHSACVAVNSHLSDSSTSFYNHCKTRGLQINVILLWIILTPRHPSLNMYFLTNFYISLSTVFTFHLLIC